MKEYMGLAWWNTGISPNRKKSRASDDEWIIASEVFTRLAAANHLIGLGEISSADLLELKKLVNPEILGLFEFSGASSKSGRSYFDTCIAYRKDLVSVIKSDDLQLFVGNRVYRIAQYFELVLTTGSQSLHVLISHWPSRINMPPSDPVRTQLGASLREKIKDLHVIDGKAQVVLLGDYNDEPFAESISEALLATRDRDLARKKSNLVYNPFWRHLSAYVHESVETSPYDKGTYYFRKGHLTKWHTFDQMMFSKALLVGEGDWKLNESDTRIMVDVDFYNVVTVKRTIFDHFPIVSRFERAES
ncbi:endonuclease/exonuclease/phosphatase family protein [Xanthomonas arboricola]|uniref:endonuclease/exonuclease/phosphatase family protein n=1 Tax=Xanthomonas arboricola TaxID=56448 RepID=UPI0012901CA2|nr:endonuclease/exonuclease/phosphatase family protein [Xanthomonas arboricola]